MFRTTLALVIAAGWICADDSVCRAQKKRNPELRLPGEKKSLSDEVSADNDDQKLQTSYAAKRPANLRAEQQIVQALQQPVAINCVKQPLNAVLSTFAGQAGIACTIDQRALEAAGVGVDTAVTISSPGNLSARANLDRMLKQLQLTWIICDESLCVTTADEANNRCTARVYPVADLVMFSDGTSRGGLATRSRNDQADFDSLIQVITSTIQPSTWDDVGGMGSIKGFDPSLSLVVSQTREAHEEIGLLLAALRKSRSTQPLARASFTNDVAGSEGEPLNDDPLPAYRSTVRQRGGASAVAAWQLPRTTDGKAFRVQTTSGRPNIGQGFGGGVFNIRSESR